MVLVSSSDLTVVLQDDGSLQLTFNPLTGKHRGDCTCKATLTWVATEIVVTESSTAQVKGNSIALLPGFPRNEVILVESLETKPAAGNSTSEAHEPSKGAKEHSCGGTQLTKFLRYRAPSYDITQWKRLKRHLASCLHCQDYRPRTVSTPQHDNTSLTLLRPLWGGGSCVTWMLCLW